MPDGDGAQSQLASCVDSTLGLVEQGPTQGLDLVEGLGPVIAILGICEAGPSLKTHLDPIQIEEIDDDHGEEFVQDRCEIVDEQELGINIQSDYGIERDMIKGDMTKDYHSDSEDSNIVVVGKFKNRSSSRVVTRPSKLNQ